MFVKKMEVFGGLLAFASMQQCRGLRPSRSFGKNHLVRVSCSQRTHGISGSHLPVLGEDRDSTEKRGTHGNITLRGQRLSNLQRFQVGPHRFLRKQKGLVYDSERQQVYYEKDAEGQCVGCFGKGGGFFPLPQSFRCIGEDIEDSDNEIRLPKFTH